MTTLLEEPHSEAAVYVYETPVRLWHWVNALCIFILCITGYFIASPFPSLPGEASDNFLMGYIRFTHFAAAYVFFFSFIGRIYWAFVGNEHARQIFMPPIFNKQWWHGVLHEIKWYLFLTPEPRKYVGHNPLAVLVMHFLFMWTVLFMIVTGFALYGEGAGYDSWQFTLFSSWVIPLFGQSQDVHTWHHAVMWVMIFFIMTHIYVAVREDIMSRQSLISTMISGWRMFKDKRDPDDVH